MRRFSLCRNHSLAIGYIAPALGNFLGVALQSFRQSQPQIEVTLFELAPALQIEALREGRLDIALIGHASSKLKREFELSTIRRVPLIAVLPSNHRLASRASIHLSELKDEDFVGVGEATFPGRNEVVREACRKAGFVPRMAHQVDGLSTLLALVGSGSGVGLVPEEVQTLPSAGVTFKYLSAPHCHIEFAAALCPGDERPGVRALLNDLRAAK
jgi:DNA-binding transcriptional LysR family regulator